MTIKPFNLYSLILETTRRCNTRCDHCLRGDPEDKVLATKHIDKLFEKLEYVSNITFTGGEPSLAPGVIAKTIHLAKEWKVSFGNFYIATNAVKTSDNFIAVIANLWNYCDDNEISAVHWSNDEYHPSMEDNNIGKLSAFTFAGARYDNGASTMLINEGRAKNLYSEKSNKREHFEVGEGCVDEGDIYLNCEGNIIGGCDWSYESQREQENIVSHVNDFSLDKVVEFNNREEERRANEL